jgi:short subunit dehydrogenase-like uncharacterized protein
MRDMQREFDVVVFGATGFTGRLVAEYIASAGRQPKKWAIAGRNRDKLQALGFDVPILVVDAMDPAACADVAKRTRVVCTTVGPYTKYGAALVAACADAGTHYCDLTGEVNFMRASIDANHERAKQTGARIVHACGFDSIPSDLGTWQTQAAFHERYGHYAQSVSAYYGETSGGLSGGTVASMFAIADAATTDKSIGRILRNPYALDPDPKGQHAPIDKRLMGWDSDLKMFYVPFLMAPTNGPVVRRGVALAGYPWGEDFSYREVMSTPGNVRGAVMAAGVTGMLGAMGAALASPALRGQLKKRLPQPGDGPSEEKREKGHWKVRYLAKRDGEKLLCVWGDPNGDPGYKSTAKMLGESALCLAYDKLTSEPGCTTPAVAMGNFLANRLKAAGLTFEVR